MGMLKKKIDIGIVILHYQNIEDTLQCVESILNRLDTDSFIVAVVDNCSPNNSGSELCRKLKNYEKVIVHLNKKNLGFSGGNNVGIRIIKEQFDPNYIVLSNSDIELIDNSFYHKIETEYNKSNFAVLGPMIINPNGRNDSNPIFNIAYPRINAVYDLRYWKKRLFATKLGLEKLYCFCRAHNPLVEKHKRKIYINRKENSQSPLIRQEGKVLHGCFMIFSREYFRYFEGLDVQTFLYAEEDILFIHLMEKKLKTVYNPDIHILHKEDGSINKSFKTTRKKKIFTYKNYIKAIKSYLLLLKQLKINNV